MSFIRLQTETTMSSNNSNFHGHAKAGAKKNRTLEKKVGRVSRVHPHRNSGDGSFKTGDALTDIVMTLALMVGR